MVRYKPYYANRSHPVDISLSERIYSPRHYSLFEEQPDHCIATGNKLERLYHRLDSDINQTQYYLPA